MLETELAAWQLDESCLIVGRRVENNMQQGKSPFDGFDMPEETRKSYSNTWHKPVKKANLNFLKQ